MLEDFNGEKYGEYLEKKDNENAWCRWCSTKIKFSTSGVTSLKNHAKSKKHKVVADGRKGRLANVLGIFKNKLGVLGIFFRNSKRF